MMIDFTSHTGILGGSGAIAMISALVGVVKLRMQKGKEEQEARDKERAQFLGQLSQQSQQTLAIVREELQVQRESNGRFFELLDRNTSALEKLVAAQSLQGQELGAIKGKLDIMQGSILGKAA